jgi:putative phage-type endonuclease
MRVINAEQGTEAWLKSRIGVPSGSNYAKIMSKGKGSEPSVTRASFVADIANEILTGERDEFPVNDAMKWGVLYEPEARSAYESRFGVLVTETGFCMHDTLNTGVSPDGIVSATKLLEIKCPQKKTHSEYMKRSDMPPAYKWQVQGQMWIMEKESCDFVSYHPNFPENAKLIVRPTMRDDKAIKELEAEIRRFLDDVQAEVEFIRNYKEPV